MNTRRKFLIQGSLSATAILAAGPIESFARYFAPVPFLNTNHTLILLHTHGMYNTTGGTTTLFKQTAAMIANLRKQNHNSLLFDTGGFSGENGTCVQLLQPLGYDAILPASLDIEGNNSLLTSNSGNTNIPVMANYYHSYSPCLTKGVLPCKIINKAGIKVGIIGAGSFISNHINKEPVEEISNLATLLKEEQHCNLVICLSNFGFKNSDYADDCSLAFGSKNVDVIIGCPCVASELLVPSVILNKSGHEVLINNTGQGVILGGIKIGFDKGKKKNHITVNNIPAALTNKTFTQNLRA